MLDFTLPPELDDLLGRVRAFVAEEALPAEAHLPFGGNGKSGNGSRQSGIWVLDQFTRWQSMNWDYAGKLQKAQMDLVEIEAQPDFRLPD